MTGPEFRRAIMDAVRKGKRLSLLAARPVDAEHLALVAVLATEGGEREMVEHVLAGNQESYLSLTPHVPQAHWFERAIYDGFGLTPKAHPRFKSLYLHESWPADFHPLREAHLVEGPRRQYDFLEVEGDGVFEIPVGPIHAGIIEPGHFRFSCLGEVIQNLEIRLGYQHRGIEEQMTRVVPWRQMRFRAESASSDTAVGNAMAHAHAMEELLQVEPPAAATLLRAVALEIERVASHIGDLGGLCADIGFAGGAAIFGRLRGQALGLGERLTGSRFQTAYILPGGVRHALLDEARTTLQRETLALREAFDGAEPMLLDNPGALDRMEGTGRVKPSLARDFGLVGPAARASHVFTDVRLGTAPYNMLRWSPALQDSGDVLARAQIRAEETRTSLDIIVTLLHEVDCASASCVPVPESLPPLACGVGMVEAWRGELLHAVFTGERGQVTRYCIKDPSFHNWTGLAIAARGELVSDFPLCNKSFGLSYSGNDL